jgi:hypothetical protein
MNQLQILRLKSGEDIIGSVEEFTANGNFHISNPMVVEFRIRNNESNLMMAHWLPVQIIKDNEAIIKENEVLTKFKPNDDFAEYYVDTVQKISTLLKQKELSDNMKDMNEEEMMEVMNALEDIANQTLH